MGYGTLLSVWDTTRFGKSYDRRVLYCDYSINFVYFGVKINQED